MKKFLTTISLFISIIFSGCGGGGGDGLPKTTYGDIYASLGLDNIVQYEEGWGSFGQYSNFVLTSEGDVYSVSDDVHAVVKLDNFHNIKKIAVGYEFMLALDSNGTVYGWGSNYLGQLGLGNNDDNITVPTAIPNFNNIIDISAGDNFGMILDSNNDVYSFGYSSNMGHSDTNATNTPKKIDTLDDKKIVKIFTGSINSLAITEDGTVYSWGSTDNYNRPILGLDRSKLDSIYLRSQLPQEITTLSDDGIKIKDASIGAWYSLLISDTNEVYGFGDGSYGNLGNNDLSYQDIPVKINNISNVKQVSASAYVSLFLDNNGNAYSTGKNSNNSALGYGKNNNGVYELISVTKIPNLSNIKFIHTDGEYSIFEDSSHNTYITQEQTITVEETAKTSQCGGMVGYWKRSNGDLLNVYSNCTATIIQYSSTTNDVLKTYLSNIEGDGAKMSYRLDKIVITGDFYNQTQTYGDTYSGISYTVSDTELHWGNSTYQRN